MKQEEQEIEVAKLVATMAACFPYSTLTDNALSAYVSMLVDIPVDVLKPSIEACVVASKFLPSIAEIRERAKELTTPRKPLAQEAFSITQQKIRDVGFYRTPKFNDSIIQKVVEAMGWQNLCLSENLVADRARFIELYDQMVQREIDDARLPPSARALRQRTDAMGDAREIGDGREF